MAAAELLLTAEEFEHLPDDDTMMELVRGKVVRSPLPGFRHGLVCGNVQGCLMEHIRRRGLGTGLALSAIITCRDPDTVRGADAAYMSYARMPRGKCPIGYPAVAPEIVFEVLSPEDRWTVILEKVGEYLNVDVLIVCVVDPDSRTAYVFKPDSPVRKYEMQDEICFAPVLPDWTVRVNQFFSDWMGIH